MAVLEFIVAQGIPGVFVRWPVGRRVDRVLIPTGGGPNVLSQLWIANEIARRHGCPATVLHVIHGRADHGVGGATLADVQARAMGLSEPVEVAVADDVVTGIAGAVRPTDLVAIGAPNNWRLPAHFGGSIPEQTARQVANPLLMLLGPGPGRARLREVFWPQMIRLGLRPRTKEEAIAVLVDTLVACNQVPANWRDRLLSQALERERVMSTGLGSETAFPHITVPHSAGVAGCMGICPEGVDFGAGGKTRFVFLLVTPEALYGDYLAVLAKIAELIALPAVRRELLACRTPADVLDVLEPEEP